MQNFEKFRLKFVFFDENHKNDHFSIGSNRHLNFINGLVDQYIVLSDENLPDFIMLIMLIIYHSADLGQSFITYYKMVFKMIIKRFKKLGKKSNMIESVLFMTHNFINLNAQM